ncbi:hypothetical protein Pgy4_40150, partial [Pseudomonas savastanoi pv. glycinea str. race 4]
RTLPESLSLLLPSRSTRYWSQLPARVVIENNLDVIKTAD